jgi:hypothetical protein
MHRCRSALVGLAALLVVGCGAVSTMPLAAAEGPKVKLAQSQTREIARVLQVYTFRHGHFPDTLTELTEPGAEGQPALLKPEAVIDPWGQPYQMDTAGPNNGGGQPDVWTTTPDGQVIGNWMK